LDSWRQLNGRKKNNDPHPNPYLVRHDRVRSVEGVAEEISMLTPERLDELESLFAECVGGEWHAYRNNAEWLIRNDDRNAFPTWIAALSIRGHPKVTAEAIAAFHNAIPDLIRAARENQKLRVALKLMLDLHGKPMREEWINQAAFEHCQAVQKQAKEALAQTGGDA
jgi:hypothetical protein